MLCRDATANLSQARPNILPQFFFLTVVSYIIETQNLGKAQALGALGALPAVAALLRASAAGFAISHKVSSEISCNFHRTRLQNFF